MKKEYKRKPKKHGIYLNIALRKLTSDKTPMRIKKQIIGDLQPYLEGISNIRIKYKDFYNIGELVNHIKSII